MFARLVNAAGVPKIMLDTQYRMHEFLLNVPNLLFYEDKIKSMYKGDLRTKFISSKKPFLFINST